MCWWGGGGGLGVLLQKILGLNGVKLCNSWQNKPENGSFKSQGWKVEFVMTWKGEK